MELERVCVRVRGTREGMLCMRVRGTREGMCESPWN